MRLSIAMILISFWSTLGMVCDHLGNALHLIVAEMRTSERVRDLYFSYNNILYQLAPLNLLKVFTHHTLVAEGFFAHIH